MHKVKTKKIIINIAILGFVVIAGLMTSGCKKCWQDMCSKISCCGCKTSGTADTQTPSEK
ncbi:MAG: hypothetical protein ABIH09_03745 [Candidatus Omnitrophota bacterium]